jgi:hypothetical protein
LPPAFTFQEWLQSVEFRTFPAILYDIPSDIQSGYPAGCGLKNASASSKCGHVVAGVSA